MNSIVITRAIEYLRESIALLEQLDGKNLESDWADLRKARLKVDLVEAMIEGLAGTLGFEVRVAVSGTERGKLKAVADEST